MCECYLRARKRTRRAPRRFHAMHGRRGWQQRGVSRCVGYTNPNLNQLEDEAFTIGGLLVSLPLQRCKRRMFRPESSALGPAHSVSGRVCNPARVLPRTSPVFGELATDRAGESGISFFERMAVRRESQSGLLATGPAATRVIPTTLTITVPSSKQTSVCGELRPDLSRRQAAHELGPLATTLVAGGPIFSSWVDRRHRHSTSMARSTAVSRWGSPSPHKWRRIPGPSFFGTALANRARQSPSVVAVDCAVGQASGSLSAPVPGRKGT